MRIPAALRELALAFSKKEVRRAGREDQEHDPAHHHEPVVDGEQRELDGHRDCEQHQCGHRTPRRKHERRER